MKSNLKTLSRWKGLEKSTEREKDRQNKDGGKEKRSQKDSKNHCIDRQ